MKQIIHITFFSLFLAGIMVLMGFIYMENGKQLLGETEVNIIRKGDRGFLSAADIMKIIDTEVADSAQKIKDLNMALLEEKIMVNPYIDQVDAFVNVDKDLVINVKEKEPFLRVFTRYGKGFYLDEEGQPFPLNDKHASMVTIASGYINLDFDELTGIPLTGEGDELLADLYYLAAEVSKSEFLKAQVSQIYLNSIGEYDLIPEVGDQVIQLGSLEDLEDKLERLELWYKKTFTKEEVEQYSTINLKFKGQVVCSRKQ
jgi:cell division protein FtsQ